MSEYLEKITLNDGTVIEKESRYVTRGVIGIAVYAQDFKAQVLYPWHRVARIDAIFEVGQTKLI